MSVFLNKTKFNALKKRTNKTKMCTFFKTKRTYVQIPNKQEQERAVCFCLKNIHTIKQTLKFSMTKDIFTLLSLQLFRNYSSGAPFIYYKKIKTTKNTIISFKQINVLLCCGFNFSQSPIVTQ